jgi:hypothetical protein
LRAKPNILYFQNLGSEYNYFFIFAIKTISILIGFDNKLTINKRDTMIKIFRCFYVFVFLAFSISCISKYNNFELDTDTVIVFPIAKGSYVLSDIIENFNSDSIFKFSDEKELFISVTEQNVIEISAADLFSLPGSLSIASTSNSLGLISIDDTSQIITLSLKDFIDRSGFDGKLDGIYGGEWIKFPEFKTGLESSFMLTWGIGNFDFIREADISSGILECTFENNFPVNVFADLILFDSYGNTLGNIILGDKNAGIAPGFASTSILSLEGKSLNPPIYVKINQLQFFGSDNQVLIKMDEGLSLKTELRNVKCNSLILNKNGFKYTSPTSYTSADFGHSVVLDKIIISTGNITIHFEKQFKPNGVVKIHFPYLKNGGEPFSASFEVSGTGLISANFDLENVDIDLKKIDGKVNCLAYYVEFEVNSSGIVHLKSSNTYSYSIGLNDLKYEYAEGFFGNRTITIPEREITLNNNIWEKYGDALKSENPELRFVIRNGLGISANSDFYLTGTSVSGANASVSNTGFPIYCRDPEQKFYESFFEFTSENSTISEFISLPPNHSIVLKSELEINPEQIDCSKNFIFFDDVISIDLGLSIPVLLKGYFFEFSDTFSFSEKAVFDNIESGELIFKTNNSIPLDIYLSIVPYDKISGFSIGNEIGVELLKSAKTNLSGFVTETVYSENSLLLSKTDMDNLSKANAIIAKMLFFSPEKGEWPARLFAANKFDLNILLNVNLSDEN